MVDNFGLLLGVHLIIVVLCHLSTFQQTELSLASGVIDVDDFFFYLFLRSSFDSTKLDNQ